MCDQIGFYALWLLCASAQLILGPSPGPLGGVLVSRGLTTFAVRAKVIRPRETSGVCGPWEGLLNFNSPRLLMLMEVQLGRVAGAAQKLLRAPSTSSTVVGELNKAVDVRTHISRVGMTCPNQCVSFTSVLPAVDTDQPVFMSSATL